MAGGFECFHGDDGDVTPRFLVCNLYQSLESLEKQTGGVEREDDRSFSAFKCIGELEMCLFRLARNSQPVPKLTV